MFNFLLWTEKTNQNKELLLRAKTKVKRILCLRTVHGQTVLCNSNQKRKITMTLDKTFLAILLFG